MKLADLHPRFLRYEKRLEEGKERVYHVEVETLAEAQGVIFLCPKCFAANHGEVGTHSVICWSSSRGVPVGAHPGPGRWAMKGTSLADLTLDGEPGRSRSVLLKGGCGWHGYITKGEATDA